METKAETIRKPLKENEVVIHVPKGTAGNVRVVEADAPSLNTEITIQVSKNRRPGVIPVLGVIVK